MPFQKGHQHWKKRKGLNMVVIAEEPPPTQEQALTMLQQIKLMRDTMNRHFIGMEKALYDYQDSIVHPECVKCYVIKGWLKGCQCNKL